MKYSDIIQDMPEEKWLQGDYVDRSGRMCFTSYILHKQGASIDYLWYNLNDLNDLYGELWEQMTIENLYKLVDINDKAESFQEGKQKAIEYLRSLGL